MYRKNEKVVLHFIKNCADKVEKVVGMTLDEAKAEIGSWGKKFRGKEYFQDTICSLLST